MSREVGSIDLSQGPGATFPEMSQAPALLGFPEQRLGVERAGVYCLQVLLELWDLGRMAQVMGVEPVAIEFSCRTVGSEYPLQGNHAPQLGWAAGTRPGGSGSAGVATVGKEYQLLPMPHFKQLHSCRIAGNLLYQGWGHFSGLSVDAPLIP